MEVPHAKENHNVLKHSISLILPSVAKGIWSEWLVGTYFIYDMEFDDYICGLCILLL